MAKRTGSIPNDVARLNGARYVFASEAEEGQKLAEATIKDITGADIISARFMRGEWFDFTPVFKIWLATNHKPKIRGRDNAIWDRIRLIPFEVSIPTSEQDPRLLDKLQAESAGILAWAVRGCQDRLQDGLQPPRKVIQATAAYRAEMDDLGLFLDEHCILKDGVVTSAKALFDAYSQWTAGDKTTQMSQKAFGGLLTEKGFERDNKGGNGRKQYIGIGLIRYSE
jgi:putative DNA primase/helicase